MQSPRPLSKRTQETIARLKQERETKSKNLIRLLLILLGMLAILLGVLYSINLKDMRDELLAEQAVLEKELEAVKAEADSLNHFEILRQQPQYIKRIARERLGMLEPDEIIFQESE